MMINGDRLWSHLMEMAKVGSTPAGGCNRQALTDTDRAGRDLFVEWCRGAGYAVRIDAIGNIFAQRAGSGDGAPVLVGSHLDTQPTGGKFDGVYGVLAGLEVLQTLDDAGVETVHPLEVAVWTNEEGCRFPSAMLGSAVWAGRLPLEEALALTDRHGASVGDELGRIGYAGAEPAAPRPLHATFELHIEQGPILEAKSMDIGIVTGVQHMSRHRVLIRGESTHAGPTPMDMRRDPVLALGRLLPALYDLVPRFGDDTRVTIGFLDASPGAGNTVPHTVELTVDVRHPDAAVYTELRAAVAACAGNAVAQLPLEVEAECVWEAPGVEFDQACVAAVAAASRQLGLASMEIVSGAGHDACNVAGVAPTGMIFIPCEGGISHNEAESITQAQAEAGANVLLHAMLDRAGAP
jgi:N-carbamoyl-L-amino-acid hydrolase